MRRVAIIGSGFSGLSASCFLAKAGFDVTVFEKNSSAGGRARKFASNGFTFDMGPSWYWMPDVIEHFFETFGKSPSEFYTLQRLDPSYRIVYPFGEQMDLPAGVDNLAALFERIEPGSGKFLLKFLEESKRKYDIGMLDLVYKPGLSIREFFDTKLLQGMLHLQVFKSVSSYVRKFFHDPRLLQLLEFPVLFLGAKPERTPALYTLMNYADMALGTWYPQGGMHKIAEAMVTLATSLGVKFQYNSPVENIEVSDSRVTGITVDGQVEAVDYIVASADYHHVEQQLLPASYRMYSTRYWETRTLAPSCLIFYLGIDTLLSGLLHHTLFFDTDFGKHASEIYDTPQWPTAPQFYVSCTSKTDPSVAPAGCENLFVLIPVAPDLHDTDEIREQYFEMILQRLEQHTNQHIRNHIVFKKSYAHRDFIDDYHAFKGNAYGLANTLAQTAHLKPSIVNKKIKNLFYTGQLTVPGPGVPPAIISGQVVAMELIKSHKEVVT